MTETKQDDEERDEQQVHVASSPVDTVAEDQNNSILHADDDSSLAVENLPVSCVIQKELAQNESSSDNSRERRDVEDSIEEWVSELMEEKTGDL